MRSEPYDWIVELAPLQRNCRLTLQIEGTNIPLSFDDAIEFKIEIARVLDIGFPSAADVCGTAADPWKAKFLPNQGGFSIAVRHPVRPIATLILNKRQTVVFSEELQDFIDQAGQRS
jgi:hypothetical protein